MKFSRLVESTEEKVTSHGTNRGSIKKRNDGGGGVHSIPEGKTVLEEYIVYYACLGGNSCVHESFSIRAREDYADIDFVS